MFSGLIIALGTVISIGVLGASFCGVENPRTLFIIGILAACSITVLPAALGVLVALSR